MIKTSILVNRKDGLSVADFQSQWLEHAQMLKTVPGVRRAIQCPTLVEEYEREQAPDYDGVAEVWWDDQAAMEKGMTSPEVQALIAHASTFIGEMMPVHSNEVVLKDAFPTTAERKDMVKYIAMLFLKEGVPIADFQRHWKNVHGPINVRNITGMKRYVQSHILPDMFEGANPPPYGGLPEAWFESVSAMRGAPRDPNAQRDTEWPNFCSGQKSIFAKEIVIIE